MNMLHCLNWVEVVRVDSRILPHHPTRTYTARFPCHPRIEWLLKLLKIKPYIEATYRCHKP